MQPLNRPRVQAPPSKPLLIWDGECGFCRRWILRWQAITGEWVEYAPLQEPSLWLRFPEVARADCERAVHLIEPDGRVSRGAEAMVRSLAECTSYRWMRWSYEGVPGVAAAAEAAYGVVARNRRVFSILTRVLLGAEATPVRHELVRDVFARCLGLNFLIAFVSLGVQIDGLIGEQGILPAAETMRTAADQLAERGWDRYRLLPTLAWLGASDAALAAHWITGAVLGGVVVLGFVPGPALALLWLLYLSLTSVAGVFLGFQWDNLLLEAGFFGALFAPWTWRLRGRSVRPASKIALWLLRWLLFRLMFESGCVKLASGEATWRDLSALSYHYQTQPLPTVLGWHAHQLPGWFHEASVLVMFGLELVVPFLIFGPRRLRVLGAAMLALLQVAILLTGNYAFFNLLTLLLCVPLLDDSVLGRMAPAGWRSRSGPGSAPRAPWSRAWVLGGVAMLTAIITLPQLVRSTGLRVGWPEALIAMQRWLAPLRTVNGYGLFAVMTTLRPEIVLEGSLDGEQWRAYEFRYKPGELGRGPRWVAPHQPRLDWQLWFAALGDYRQNPWFIQFCARVLQGSPTVLGLLEHNPFPDAPPKSLRATVYDYRFTTPAERRSTRAWWRRERRGPYCPVLSLKPAASAAVAAPEPGSGPLRQP
jgi:predicted DCC family thiol-disulfide oxidoreductase YuxK